MRDSHAGGGFPGRCPQRGHLVELIMQSVSRKQTGRYGSLVPCLPSWHRDASRKVEQQDDEADEEAASETDENFLLPFLHVGHSGVVVILAQSFPTRP